MSNYLTHNQILLSNAERLGIQDKSAVKKADEYLRLLNTKNIGNSISDVAKAVICLDLATTAVGIVFSKETALKLTGLRKSIYQNNLNNIQKVLNLDKLLTISEVCVQLSCTAARETAEAILESYKQVDLKVKDITHPQYPAAAVYTACRIKNIKVEKSQFVTISRLKSSQWKELVEDFSKFVQSSGFTSAQNVQNKNTQRNNTFGNITESAKSENVKNLRDGISQDEPKVEEYEVWRQRILSSATAALLNRELRN